MSWDLLALLVPGLAWVAARLPRLPRPGRGVAVVCLILCASCGSRPESAAGPTPAGASPAGPKVDSSTESPLTGNEASSTGSPEVRTTPDAASTGEAAPERAERSADQEPTTSVAGQGFAEEPDDGYTGPLDPTWPPVHPADLEIELRVAEMLREQLAAGVKSPLDDGPLMAGDVPGVFARRGRLAGFEFLEVILGEVEHPDVPLPLVVLFHGRGGRPHIPHGAFSSGARVRVLFPQGPDRLGAGYHWLATYTNSGKTEVLTRSLSARADQLAVMIEAFRQSRPTIGRPALAGFSQGGIITYALAARYPGRYSGAFPIAGWLPPLLLPSRLEGTRLPVMVAHHGDRDTVVPTALGRLTAEQMKQRGFPLRYQEYSGVAHVVTDAMTSAVRRDIESVLRDEAQRVASLHGASPQARVVPAATRAPCQ